MPDTSRSCCCLHKARREKIAPVVHVKPVVVFGRPPPIAVLVVTFRNVLVSLHHFKFGSTVDEPVVSPTATVIPLPQPVGAASRYLHVVLQSEPVDVKFVAET